MLAKVAEMLCGRRGEVEAADRVAQVETDRMIAIEERVDEFGITRVGDITDLDIVGIPVWFACRPNSRSLSQAQGKGMDASDARASAVMEAVEHHFAENADRLKGNIAASYASLGGANAPPVPLGTLPGCRISNLDLDRIRMWCAGYSLYTGKTFVAPYELVGLDARVSSPWDRYAFSVSSVGLGAGVTRQHAVLHALLEVIENNATLLPDLIGLVRLLEVPLDYRAGHAPVLDELVDRVRCAGLTVRFLSVPGPIAIPVIGAFISPSCAKSVGVSAATYGGYACRMTAVEAATDALLEAVQSRLTDIAGARDDIEPLDYQKIASPEPCESQAAIRIDALESCWSGGTQSDPGVILEFILGKLKEAGVGDVFCFDLNENDVGPAVVRVLVEGFEHAGHEGDVELGVQGIAALLRAADNLR